MSGQPLQIIKNNENRLELDTKILIDTLLTKEIEDRFVCVISIAGALRKGKSFMLNFCLRYMYMKYGHTNITDFLGDENQHLSGFSWHHGTDPVTGGILMWSDVFLHDNENGDKIAIILLDTQGAFDHQSTVRSCASIFAFSTMLSSVQIYNLSTQIQENDLQYLQLFIEYGKLALKYNDSKPFQNLMFLIRDWGCINDFEYGEPGGFYYLKDVLKIMRNTDPQLNILREHIKAYFVKISCFLMPHPGLKVASEPNFKGCLKDISVEFKDYLHKLIPLLLSPENLVIKEINGKKLRAKDWTNYVQSYFEVFNNPNLPEPQTVFLATAKVSNQACIEKSRDLYNNLMSAKCSDITHIPEEALLSYHTEYKQETLSYFEAEPKFGNDELIQNYQNQLEAFIETDFDRFIVLNNGKSSELETAISENIIKATQNYYNLLQEHFGNDKKYVKPEIMEKFHLIHMNEILLTLQNGGEEHREKLKRNLNDKFKDIVEMNDNKISRMEANALKLVQSVQKKYIEEMENKTKNYYVDNFERLHMEIKDMVLSQFNELSNQLSDEQITYYYRILNKFFEDRFEYFALNNQNNYDYLKTSINNSALSARLKFINLLNGQQNLTGDICIQIANETLQEFDTSCKDINNELWCICREQLNDDLVTTSNYLLSNLNNIKSLTKEDQLTLWLEFAELFGNLALGGSKKLAEFGVMILKASKAFKAAVNTFQKS